MRRGSLGWMDAVVVTRSVDLAAPPERVWPLVSDTDRFNRLLGMAAVNYRPVDAGNKTGARFVGETRAGGFTLAYDELPFEWTHERAFSVHRRMHGGPVSSLTWRCTLERTRAGDAPGALEGGTRATLRLEIVPRVQLLRPVAWLNAKRVAASFGKLGPIVDAHVLEGAPSPYVVPASTPDRERVDAAVAQLREGGVAPALAERIGAFVRDGADADVIRVRPFALADEWGEDRRAVLRAFLRAVPIGLRRAPVGRSCVRAAGRRRSRRSASRTSRPRATASSATSPTTSTWIARSRRRFEPHPAMRRVPEAMFCIGGPARTPHVLVQATVDAGADAHARRARRARALPPVRRGGATATLEVDSARRREGRDATLDASRRSGRRSSHAAPGGELAITNGADDDAPREDRAPRLRERRGDGARRVDVRASFARSSRRICSSAARRSRSRGRRSSSAISPARPRSTRKVGDAAAFRLVDDHFDVLREVVDAHDGVVVKTMGDAVMAAFVDARQCVARGDRRASRASRRSARSKRTASSSDSSSGSTRGPATS